MRHEIKGVIGDPSSIYNTNVWSKIYDTRVLKSAVENISETLYYAEDVCLNMWAFFDNLTRRVSARGESYYIWNVGIGFSSLRGAENTLFSEYKYIKPLTVKLLKSVNCPSSAFKQCYMESIYFQKAIIQNMIRDKIDMKSCIQKIEEMMQCDFIIEAKAYIATNFKDKSWEELKFLTSEYTADEYYYYCLNHMPQNTLKYSIGKLLNILKKL